MKSAIAELEHEHRIIQTVLAVMGRLVDNLEYHLEISPDVLRDLVQFIRIFGDQCHHNKEESYLFPLLEKNGAPATGCPLGALRAEHQKSRHFTAILSTVSGDYIANHEAGRLALIEALQHFVELYPEHIWKEEFLLFPMAQKMLSENDQQSLLQQFSLAEADIGTHAHSAYEALAKDLAQRVGLDLSGHSPAHVA